MGSDWDTAGYWVRRGWGVEDREGKGKGLGRGKRNGQKQRIKATRGRCAVQRTREGREIEESPTKGRVSC